MPVESATWLDQLNTANPTGTDKRYTEDDHLRLIKKVLRRSFKDLGHAVSASAGEFNQLRGTTATLQTQINTRLNVSATATNAVLWEGSRRYESTASATGGSDGDLYFQWD